MTRRIIVSDGIEILANLTYVKQKPNLRDKNETTYELYLIKRNLK